MITCCAQLLAGPSQVSYLRDAVQGITAAYINLNVELDAAKVEATLKDGILTLVLGKAEPAKPKQIAIN